MSNEAKSLGEDEIIPSNIKIDDYSESSFWEKCKKYCKSIGEEGLSKVFQLYYALDSDKCGAADKAVIYGALAYLISPIDAIPDLTPIFGYTDDIAIIAAALVKVSSCIDEEVIKKAKQKVNDLLN
ncbi:YkvA family protein [Thalassotalea litorea]|uniref:YkvA family protein n=1 Tax=Thalassotalea litorea TaxID=2020715 RepID=UPI003736D2E9